MGGGTQRGSRKRWVHGPIEQKSVIARGATGEECSCESAGPTAKETQGSQRHEQNDGQRESDDELRAFGTSTGDERSE